jgi:hypothetical protein
VVRVVDDDTKADDLLPRNSGHGASDILSSRRFQLDGVGEDILVAGAEGPLPGLARRVQGAEADLGELGGGAP